MYIFCSCDVTPGALSFVGLVDESFSFILFFYFLLLAFPHLEFSIIKLLQVFYRQSSIIIFILLIMSSRRNTVSNEEGVPPLNFLSNEEQLFVARYLDPRLDAFNKSVNAFIDQRINERNKEASDKIDLLLNEHIKLAKEDVIGQLRHEFNNKLTSFVTSVDLENGLVQEVGVKMHGVKQECLEVINNHILASTPPPPSSSAVHTRVEPPAIPGLLFDGDVRKVAGFLSNVKDYLTSTAPCFSNDDRKITWVARHFPLASAPHDWWLSLLHENDLDHGPIDEYSTEAVPFGIAPLKSLGAFFKAFVDKFGDKNVLKNLFLELQSFRQSKLLVAQYISCFNGLAFRLNLPGIVLREFFRKGLNTEVNNRAAMHPEWTNAMTVDALQKIALIAADQLAEIVPTRMPQVIPHSQSMQKSFSSPPVVSVPRDPNAMDVDIHAINQKAPFPDLPNGVPFDVYRRRCHAKVVCHRCLRPYNRTHKSPSGKGIPCPFPVVPSTRHIEIFMREDQPPVSTAVAAVQLPSSSSSLQSFSSVYPPTSFPTLPAPDIRHAFHQVPVPPQPQHVLSRYMIPPYMTQPLPPSQYGNQHIPMLPSMHSNASHFNPSASSQIQQSVVSQTQPVTFTNAPDPQVLALFSEYRNIDEPYEAGSFDFFDDKPMFDPTENGIIDSQTPIAAIHFKNSPGFDSRLILRVLLLSNGKTIESRALVDSGCIRQFLG